MGILLPLCFSLFFVLAAQAQDLLDQLPSCTHNCSRQLLEQISCSSTDKLCLCTDPKALMQGIVECSTTLCSVRDTLFTTNSTLSYCDVPQRDNSLVLQVISGVLGGLALLCVVTRMFTRVRPFNAVFGWDDGFILAVMVVTVFLTIDQFASTSLGYGRDIWTIPPDNITPILKCLYATEIMYLFGISGTKLSILAFYLRIFIDRAFKRMTFSLMGIVVVFCVIYTVPTIWQCTPVSFFWTSWSGETKGRCINIFLFSWIATSMNIVLDILIILLPIPHLLKLTLSRKKKIQIISMFSVGLFITLTSVIRLQSLIHFKATDNFSWDYVGAGYMSILENDVGIICACLPAIQLLVRRMVPSIFGSSVDQASYLHPHTTTLRSRTRPFRHTNSHGPPPKGITKTITTTIINVLKDSDSVIELVNNDRQDHPGGNVDASSFETVSSKQPQKLY